MTERKNVTLPEPYDRMFKDLKAQGDFSRAFGSFSEFVQAMIEDFHDNPERVRAEHHKKKMEKHEQLMENFEEQAGAELEDSERELEKEENEFFHKFLQVLEEKKGTKDWRDNPKQVFENYEKGWLRKYANQFASIQQKEFREKFREYINDEKLRELGLMAEVEQTK